VHAAHAWTFYESAQRADNAGPYKGVPYDGNITQAAGAGKWWGVADPQALYAQRHGLSTEENTTYSISKYWDWQKGVNVPDKAYCEKFYNRTIALIDKYEPDLIYFDDTALPLWPISDAGLRIAAHFYNKSLGRQGKQEAVIFGKILTEQQRKCMVWDIERGQSNAIEPLPWQTDTCLGDWHYDRRIYDNNKYKTAKTVIHTLVDVVSKNGNLLLNVPVRGDGTIDDKERKIVEEIAEWMKWNGEGIFNTRPWKIFGEGPASEFVVPLNAQGFNEGKGKPFTGQDIRFTTKGEVIYAIALGAPENGKVTIKSLAENSANYGKRISKVILVENGQQLDFERTAYGLIVQLPVSQNNVFAYSLKILPA
jgi:alpha-L-fucosidase